MFMYKKAHRSSQREIEEFEENNGISIQAFKATCQYYPKPVEIQLDARKSAFGATIAIDPEFVPCRIEQPQERVHKQRKAKEPQKITRKQPLPQKPVDFVYDLDTRKQLREALDKERMELIQQTKEREKTLRVANLWLFDRRGEGKKHKIPKKHTKACWQEDSVQQEEIGHQDIIWNTKEKSTKKKTRPSTAKGKRNSVAENVHRYEIQTQAYHQNEDITIERR
ncbi:hypothetical protein THRCLA_21675 [Thraustotheca clavata]|uniref:Uncharacterized protein n=1 Tax=Thraustotheca clavata TaxID=74557 RepID=A0A1V9ZRH0_9STRA|nr:hypothetical protein THRCLA_21675 [Thraustotheca clavata]